MSEEIKIKFNSFFEQYTVDDFVNCIIGDSKESEILREKINGCLVGNKYFLHGYIIPMLGLSQTIYSTIKESKSDAPVQDALFEIVSKIEEKAERNKITGKTSVISSSLWQGKAGKMKQSFRDTVRALGEKCYKKDTESTVSLEEATDKYIKLLQNSADKNVLDDIEKYIKSLFTDESIAEDLKVARREDENYYMNEIVGYIKSGMKQIILTGAPGTGKTRIAKLLAQGKPFGENVEAEIKGHELIWKQKENEENQFYEFVQFHPSYDYTDFVEGLRPVKSGTDAIQFVKLDGIFKRFCRYVAEYNAQNKEQNEKDKFYFIIDEINRADLSKVFGELMYCLESDKRGSKNKIQTQYQNLPVSYTEEEIENRKKFLEKINTKGKRIEETEDVFKDGFYIPENVIIIGTMNDIDRSVESMDFALRRRFIWKEIKVDETMLTQAFKEMENGRLEKVAFELTRAVLNLNTEMKKSGYGLNAHYDISQGQFAGLPSNIYDLIEEKDLKAFLDKVYSLRIEPLLSEYVRGEEGAEAFVKKCKEAFEKMEENSNSNKES